MTAKISKIILNPSRTVNLGNYNSAKLDAGIELTFDKPVAIDSKEVKEGFEEARKVIREEFIKQFEPYKRLLAKKEEGGEQNG